VTMQVIPAIDLLGGKAVRLRQGRYDDVTVYDDDPVALAASFKGRVTRLHVVDLDGARDGRAAEKELVRGVVVQATALEWREHWLLYSASEGNVVAIDADTSRYVDVTAFAQALPGTQDDDSEGGLAIAASWAEG